MKFALIYALVSTFLLVSVNSYAECVVPSYCNNSISRIMVLGDRANCSFMKNGIQYHYWLMCRSTSSNNDYEHILNQNPGPAKHCWKVMMLLKDGKQIEEAKDPYFGGVSRNDQTLYDGICSLDGIKLSPDQLGEGRFAFDE